METPKTGWVRPVRGSDPRRWVPLTRKECHRVYRRVTMERVRHRIEDRAKLRWMERWRREGYTPGEVIRA